MSLGRREFLGATAAALLAGRGEPAFADQREPMIDCHTHFYDPSRPQGVPWPPKEDRILYRTVLPKNFLEQAAPYGVTKTIAVEASPWVEDNAWLLELAAANPSIVGVVGNLKPGKPEFAAHLKRFAANRLFRGIRVDRATLADALIRPETLADIRRLIEHGLELDVNGGPDLLTDVPRLARKLPELRIVINHLANTDSDGGPAPAEWRAGMAASAQCANVFCKVSALVEHARPKGGKRETVPADVDFYRAVLDVAWAEFGDDRLIFGSNWPVSDRSAPYATVFSVVNQYVRARGQQATQKFFWRNARVAYALA